MSRSDRNPYPFHQAYTMEELSTVKPASASVRALWAAREARTKRKEGLSVISCLALGAILAVMIGFGIPL